MSAPGAPEVLLCARGVSAARGSRVVVRGVDLELRRGEVVVALGPNGAGKSTVLAVLAGLLPVRAGDLEVRGRVAAALQSPALARRSARANVEAALAWWGTPRAERPARARDALARLGAAHLAERAAGELSGGEARRVHLARALAVAPDILLLDEPFAGLDTNARAELLYETVSEVRSPDRATMVVVHDRAEAWALADRVVIMLDGEVAAAGTPREVFEHPPSPRVAEFVGFSGRLAEPDCVLLLRPTDVALDPGGALSGRIVRATPLEEGTRLEVELPGGRGRLVVLGPVPPPEPGSVVRLRLTGGVRFPAEHDRGAQADATPVGAGGA